MLNATGVCTLAACEKHLTKQCVVTMPPKHYQETGLDPDIQQTANRAAAEVTARKTHDQRHTACTIKNEPTHIQRH